MSRVYLIAADKPLPLCDKRAERTSVIPVSGTSFTVTALQGFRVCEHSYYRSAVEVLGFPMKSYRYELDLTRHPDDLAQLLEYLRSSFASDESVELWSVWVGVDQSRPVRYGGAFEDFDMDTLEQLVNPPERDGIPGQCCLTVHF